MSHSPSRARLARLMGHRDRHRGAWKRGPTSASYDGRGASTPAGGQDNQDDQQGEAQPADGHPYRIQVPGPGRGRVLLLDIDGQVDVLGRSLLRLLLDRSTHSR